MVATSMHKYCTQDYNVNIYIMQTQPAPSSKGLSTQARQVLGNTTYVNRERGPPLP